MCVLHILATPFLCMPSKPNAVLDSEALYTYMIVRSGYAPIMQLAMYSSAYSTNLFVSNISQSGEMLTLALTVALLVLPSLNHAEIYYIRPSVSTTCSMHPCYTLSVYAEHHHHHFKNITLQFLPGDHALDVNITTEKIQQLEIIGNSSEVIPTRVICSSNVGFAFRYISKVKVNGLAFISCARISRDPSLTHTYIPHYALYLESVLMTVIADCTFQDSYGSALVVIGSHVVLRGKNNFISNGRSCIRGGHDRPTQCDCYGPPIYYFYELNL